MKIAIAQMNPTIGDIEGNLAKVYAAYEKSKAEAPDLIVLSEMFLTGYPPKDLLCQPNFLKKTNQALKKLIVFSKKYPLTGLLIGLPIINKQVYGKGVYNSAALIFNGAIEFVQHKSLLPTYDVFDECRYFDAATSISVCKFKDEVLGISICEDAWSETDFFQGKKIYKKNPMKILAKKGATLLINIAASPFRINIQQTRLQMFKTHSKDNQLPLICVNQMGGNDELVFDGSSFFLDKKAELKYLAPSFEESLAIIDTKSKPSTITFNSNKIVNVYQALVTGIRDYMRKCYFSKNSADASAKI
jgi:NAD+ synthase (glutamine-hydrolysing)